MDTKTSYAPGDFIKVEFPAGATGIGEWMWVRVTGCDEKKHVIFGVLDSEPLNEYRNRIELGSEVVISFSQIRQ